MTHAFDNNTTPVPNSSQVLNDKSKNWRDFARELFEALIETSFDYFIEREGPKNMLSDDNFYNLPLPCEAEVDSRNWGRPRALPLLSVILLARAFHGVDQLRKVLDAGEANKTDVTVLQTHSPHIAEEIAEILETHILKKSDWKVDNPVKIFTADNCTRLTPSRDKSVILSGFSPELRRAFLAPQPVLCVVPNLQGLPKQLRRLVTDQIQASGIDRDILRVFLELSFPDSPLDTLDLVDDEVLSILSIEDFVLAARAQNPDALVAALQEAGIRNKSAGSLFRDFPVPEHIKEPLLRMLADLKAWQSGEINWEDVSRGFLLEGPPGSGKTEIARALSREAGVRVVAGSLSKWQAGGERHNDFMKVMRRFFADAADQAPAIVFIDELDAFGNRDRRLDHNSAYTDSVVTALIECLDGFENTEGVVFIGATNHVRKIDAAILRPGRFDKILSLGHPDVGLMNDVFRFHLGDALEGVDLSGIVARAAGLSGADIAAIVRDAKSIARANKRPLTLIDLEAALTSVRPEFPDKLKRRIAVHEAGHAIIATALNVGTVLEVSLSNDGGSVKLDRHKNEETVEHLLELMSVDLAGRAAEKCIFGDFSAGAGGQQESDLAKATRLALAIERSLGLSELNEFWYEDVDAAILTLSRDPGLQRRVQKHLNFAHDQAVQILQGNFTVLEKLAAVLEQKYLLLGEGLAELLESVVPVSTDNCPSRRRIDVVDVR